MNLEELKEIIKNEIKPYIIIKGKTPWQYKQNKLLFQKLNQKYNNLFQYIQELIYLIKNYDNLENLHIFCYCGNKNKSKGINGYFEHCSVKCCVNDKQHQEKLKLSKLNNIDKNGLNSYQRSIIKIKQTKKERYNNENYNNINKIKQTCLNKYNVDNPYKCKFVINKIHLTKINNIDNNGLNSYERSVIKHKENYLKKYNVDSYFKTQQFKDKFKSKIFKEKFLYKQYKTKKKNNSFNTSKQEEQVYNYLLQKFNKDNIIRQYKNELYPFNVDFYIKSLDLYIECNFHWTHCPIKDKYKPFKNSIEDLIELEKLKNKNSKFYNNAIYVWTKLDPLKLSYFKKNKLNYKIFYNLKQFNSWFNKI